MQGLMDWLFSGLGSVGVEIPRDTSLRSLVTFFLQLMGITWPNIRTILARHVGEQNVALVEQDWQLVSTLITQGPAGIFEMIRAQLDPRTILNTVMDAAIDYVRDALISRVAVRLLAMLNPAGAILSAIEAIYRVVRWIFENAARIFTLAETLVNGARDLMRGNVGGRAGAIEGALVRVLPPVIDFLAGFIGLGNLPQAIANVIRGLQRRVLAVVERVIGFIAAQARRLLAALGVGGARGHEEEDRGAWWNIRKGFQDEGESHTISVTKQDNHARIMVASTPKPLIHWIDQVRDEATRTRLERDYAAINTDIQTRADTPLSDQEVEQRRRDVREKIDAIIRELKDADVLADEGDVELDGNRLDRLIYQALVGLARRLYFGWNRPSQGLAARSTAPRSGRPGRRHAEAEQRRVVAVQNQRETPIEPNVPLNRVQRTLASIQAAYHRAAIARAPRGNVTRDTAPNQFDALERPYFVDQIQNNYIAPSRVVTGVRVNSNGKIGANPANIMDRYSYSGGMPMERLRRIFQSLAQSTSPDEDHMAMFLAAMVAEPSRYSVAHITNLLAVGDPRNNTNNAFSQLSMTRGHTDPGPERTVELGSRLAGLRGSERNMPRVVTDRDLQIVKRREDIMSRIRRAFEPHRRDNVLVPLFEDTLRPFVLRAGDSDMDGES